jgi:hypothetical protein
LPKTIVETRGFSRDLNKLREPQRRRVLQLRDLFRSSFFQLPVKNSGRRSRSMLINCRLIR